MQKMDEILDYHPEDFDVCVRPGVTREGEREHLTLIGTSLENKKIVIFSATYSQVPIIRTV